MCRRSLLSSQATKKDHVHDDESQAIHEHLKYQCLMHDCESTHYVVTTTQEVIHAHNLLGLAANLSPR